MTKKLINAISGFLSFIYCFSPVIALELYNYDLKGFFTIYYNIYGINALLVGGAVFAIFFQVILFLIIWYFLVKVIQGVFILFETLRN